MMVNILGQEIHELTKPEALKKIATAIRRRKPIKLGFYNTNLANKASEDAELQLSLKTFFLLNDGIGADIALYMLHGRNFPENLNGTDFTPELLMQLAKGTRIFMLGANKQTIASAARRLMREMPHLIVCGYHHGYFPPQAQARVLSKIAAAKADVVLLGMGNPRQEKLANYIVPQICPAALCIGAWFDFYTYTLPRAPVFIRRLRLEWLYRLALEPKRLSQRYLVGAPIFLMRVWWSARNRNRMLSNSKLPDRVL